MVSPHRADFIEGQHIDNALRVEAFLSAIEADGFAIEPYDTASELKRSLIPRLQQDVNVRRDGEFACYCLNAPDKAESRISELKAQEHVAGIERNVDRIIKKRFREVDCFYRHIRNALAHGCIKRVQINGADGVLLHDVNQNNELSSVMAFTFARAHLWVTLRYQMMNG